MSDSSNYTQREWLRILRNAAAFARLQVLSCLRDDACFSSVGKGAGGDTTKKFDLIAEQTMIEYLTRFKEFTLISEEAGTLQFGNHPSGYVVLDPIDGSTNLSHRLLLSCISVAYCSDLTFKAVEAAVVLELFSGRCYFAIQGSGAYCHRERITPAEPKPLEQTLVGVDTEFPPSKITDHKALDQPIHYTRHLGANALELCYVADGTLDGFIDLRGVFRGTDLAAASLILREAGAVLLDTTGQDLEGKCSNDETYAYVAAHNLQFGQLLLQLAKGNQKQK